MRQFLVAMIGRSPSCARSLLAALYRLSPLVKFPQPLDYGQRAPTITPFFGPPDAGPRCAATHPFPCLLCWSSRDSRKFARPKASPSHGQPCWGSR